MDASADAGQEPVDAGVSSGPRPEPAAEDGAAAAQVIGEPAIPRPAGRSGRRRRLVDDDDNDYEPL